MLSPVSKKQTRQPWTFAGGLVCLLVWRRRLVCGRFFAPPLRKCSQQKRIVGNFHQMMLHGAVQANDTNDPNQVNVMCLDGAMAQQRIRHPDENGNHKAITDQHLDVGTVDIKIVAERRGLGIPRPLHDDFLPEQGDVILLQSHPPQRQTGAEKVVHFLHECRIGISPRQNQHHKREQQDRVAGEHLHRFSCNRKPFLEGGPQGIPLDKLHIQFGADT